MDKNFWKLSGIGALVAVSLLTTAPANASESSGTLQDTIAQLTSDNALITRKLGNLSDDLNQEITAQRAVMRDDNQSAHASVLANLNGMVKAVTGAQADMTSLQSQVNKIHDTNQRLPGIVQDGGKIKDGISELRTACEKTAQLPAVPGEISGILETSKEKLQQAITAIDAVTEQVNQAIAEAASANALWRDYSSHRDNMKDDQELPMQRQVKLLSDAKTLMLKDIALLDEDRISAMMIEATATYGNIAKATQELLSQCETELDARAAVAAEARKEAEATAGASPSSKGFFHSLF